MFIGIIIAVIIGLILIVAVTGRTFSPNPPLPEDNKKTVTCDVSVKKTTFSAKIDVVSCDAVPKCSFWDGQRLGFFSQKGTVLMKDSRGTVDKDDYNLKLLIDGKQKVTLKGCTADEKVEIRLLDDESNLIESKEVNI